MSLARPSAVIFDMDGTTVRHLNPWLLNFLEFGDDALFRANHLIGAVAARLHLGTFSRAKRGKRKPRLIVHRALHKMRRKPVEEIVEPCPGVIDLLELFQTHQIPVGLVSNGLGQGYGHDILSQFDLDRLFKASVFREDFSRSKPDPEPLIKILSALKSTYSRDDVVWYIGDRPKDIVAAFAAMPHIRPRLIPIGYGLRTGVGLLRHNLGADHLVTSYETWYPVVEDILTAAS